MDLTAPIPAVRPTAPQPTTADDHSLTRTAVGRGWSGPAGTLGRAQVLQLQQAVGNRAVARALGRATVQRRIGFEIETGIPITKRTQARNQRNPRYRDITPTSVGAALPVPQGKILPDHIPGKPAHQSSTYERFDEWPIIELVTDPISDTLTMPAFELIARQWIQTLTTIKAQAQMGPPAQHYRGPYYVGLPSAQQFAAEDWDRIAPQATVGVPLDQVGKILGAFDPAKGAYRVQLATEIGKQAASVAANIMQDLLATHGPGTDGGGVEGVKALLTMMVNHLKCGGNAEISKQAYIKNRPANVMFKTKLSTVRQNIIGGTFPTKVLGAAPDRAILKAKLLAATGRAQADPVFIAGAATSATNVTVGTWIDEVLDGTDDKVFEEMKNAWAAELTPDAPNEMIIELRQLGSFSDHSNFTLNNDAGLLAFLKKVYGAHQLYKERKL